MWFLLCAGFAGYVLVGYPLLLGLWSKWRPRPIRPERRDCTVTILLPVHNGKAWIARKLENLRALDYPQELVQTIVISDGSTDGTDEIAARYPVELLRVPQGGKARALNAGLERATGEILFLTDVRQEIDAQALRYLVNCFSDPQVGVVSGELIIRDGVTREEQNIGLYWKYEKLIRKSLSRIDSMQGATGAICAVRRKLMRPLPPGTLLDDVLMPMQVLLSGYRVVMEERARAYDVPTGLEAEFWRKVRTQAGIYQLLGLMPGLLGPKNRMWLHFASYKFARLLLPFALLGMAISTAFLPAPWREWAAVLQILFYGLAAVNAWVPAKSPLKRLSAPASAFVVLVGAALCAVSIFFMPPERLWKR